MKIAVKCESPNVADRVQRKISGKNFAGSNARFPVYLYETLGWDQEMVVIRDGYRIISASEYLGDESVEEFKVGDEVEATAICINDFENCKGIVEIVDGNEWRVRITKSGRHLKVGELTQIIKWPEETMKLVSNTKREDKVAYPIKEDVTMGLKKVASEVYDKTSDAELVDKWAEVMGIRHDKFGNVLFVRQNKAEFLKEAKRLQAEQDKS